MSLKIWQLDRVDRGRGRWNKLSPSQNLKNLHVKYQLCTFYGFRDLRVHTEEQADRQTDMARFDSACVSDQELYGVGNTAFYLLHTFRRI